LALSTALQPWDDAQMARDLMHLVPTLPRQALSSLRPADTPSGPGAYLQFMAASEDLVPVLGAIVASGRYVLYAGLAKDLRERMGRYRVALRRTGKLTEGGLWVALMPCASLASAAFAEAALISGLSPIMNAIGGWGSQAPGTKRSGQRVSDADCLIGHWWSRPPSLLEVARARLRVAAHLAQMPDQPRWPALLPEGGGQAAAARTAPGQELRLLRGGLGSRRAEGWTS